MGCSVSWKQRRVLSEQLRHISPFVFHCYTEQTALLQPQMGVNDANGLQVEIVFLPLDTLCFLFEVNWMRWHGQRTSR